MFLAVGLLLIALNLRIGVASVGPVLPLIREDLGLSATAASLLTTIPVVAFGAFAFLTPPLAKRWGFAKLLGVTMVVLALGFALRLHPSLLGLFAGTVMVGAAIAIGNVVMPAAIKQDFPRRTGLMMGLYATVLFIGAALASGLTAPLATALDGQWRPALALWAIPAVIALLVWLPQMFRRTGGETPHDGSSNAGNAVRTTPLGAATTTQAEPSFRRLMRDPLAWAITAHMGLQSMAYYTFLTWVPTLLQDHGMDPNAAGYLVSYSTAPAIVTSLLAPFVIGRLRPEWLSVVLSVLPFAVAYVGLSVAPLSGAMIWMTLLGIGQGLAFSLAMSFIVRRSPDAKHTGHVSTLAQGVGYLMAGLGPLGIGMLHTATDGWTLPLLALGVLLVLQLVAGLCSAVNRHVLERAASTSAVAAEEIHESRRDL